MVERVVGINKLTKLEYDMRQFGLSKKDVIGKYRHEGVDVETILSSHHRQKIALKRLRTELPEVKFFGRDKTAQAVAKAEIVIVFGGDNHFTYVSQFVGNQLVIGVNSDPERSDGALNKFGVEDFLARWPQIKKGDFRVEEWSRIDVSVNGSFVGRALSEVFLGERARCAMSRHILEFGKIREEQKSSGLLVTTGAGSTGWYNSAVRYLRDRGDKFSKMEKKLKFVLTEPFDGRLTKARLMWGEMIEDQVLLVRSLNDDGVIALDAIVTLPFRRGTTAELKLSKSNLRVIA